MADRFGALTDLIEQLRASVPPEWLPGERLLVARAHFQIELRLYERNGCKAGDLLNYIDRAVERGLLMSDIPVAGSVQ